MTEKTDEERVSIWSTGDTERTWLIALAVLFFVSSLSLVLWYNWYKITEPDYDAIITVISIIGSIGLFAITLAFFIIEGVSLMIVPVQKIRAETERYLEKRFQDGQRKGIEQGIEQGLRESILDVLEIRFDMPELHPLSARIAAIDDLQRLKQLHRAAIQVSSLEAFQHLLDA